MVRGTGRPRWPTSRPRGGRPGRGCARRWRAGCPGYMVPAAVVALDALPLTQRQARQAALPAPVVRAGAGRPVDAPRTDLERLLAELFAASSGCRGSASTTTSSPSAGTRCSRCGWSAGVRRGARTRELPVREVFDAPTVAGLAARLGAGAGRRGRRCVAGARDSAAVVRAAAPVVPAPARGPEPRPTTIPFAWRLRGAARRRRAAGRAWPTSSPGTRACGRSSRPPTATPRQVVVDAPDGAVVVADVPCRRTRRSTRALREACATTFALDRELPVRGLAVPAPGRTTTPSCCSCTTSPPTSGRSGAGRRPRRRLRGPARRRAPRPGRRCRCSTPTTRSGSASCSVDRATLAYWRAAPWPGAPEELALPADRPRPDVATSAGGTVERDLDADGRRGLREAGPGARRQPVHGRARRRRGAAHPARRGHRHAARHAGRRAHGRGAGRPGRVLRQHPGAAHRHLRRPDVRRAAGPGARDRPGRVRPPGRAVRAAGRGAEPGAVARPGTRCSR